MPYSCLPSDLRVKFEGYVTAYNQAEKALKLFEVSTFEGLIFPSVNELRCAGQHIARALSASSVEISLEEISHATRHARRAQYDAYDAVINYYLSGCKVFQEDYKAEPISGVNPDYAKEKIEIEQLVKDLSQEDRSQIENYVDQKDCQLSKVQAICEKWNSTREELNKKIKIRQKSAKVQFWTLVAAILTLVFTIVACSLPQK